MILVRGRDQIYTHNAANFQYSIDSDELVEGDSESQIILSIEFPSQRPPHYSSAFSAYMFDPVAIDPKFECAKIRNVGD